MRTVNLEIRLDRLYQKWLDVRALHTKAMVSKDRETERKAWQKMEELKRQQVVAVAESLGFIVEFPEDMKRVDINKFYLKKRSMYSAVAFFEAGRLKTIIKANRSDTMRFRYLINGQTLRGCKNIYWRPLNN